MPLKSCESNGVKGWKWGDEGKCYTGPGAKEKALKQGKAMHVQASFPIHDVIFLPEDEPGPWSLADKENHEFIKEGIYEGNFELPGGVPLKVDAQTLKHWEQSVKEMTENGVKIPLPVGHTTDAEKNRGEILDAYVGERGDTKKKALFLRVKFRDEESAKLAETSQVSIYSPPEFIDGKGNRYVRPITHVALTDYPVIPGLQGFKSIAASFVSNHEEAIMPLKELAARLKIEGENDEQLADAIVLSFETLQSDHTKVIEAKDKEIEALKAKVPADPITVSASHLSMLKDNRVMKLSQLVGERISPAVKDGLVDLFCSPEALTLSLSTEKGDNGLFDKLVELLAKNETTPLGEATDIIVLGKDGISDPKKNPLLADAERRAKAAS